MKERSARTPLPAAPLARWYAANGDQERALGLLEQLAAERPLTMRQIRNDPAFDRLRSSPRFKRLNLD